MTTTTRTATVDGEAFAHEWGVWHDAHEARRADPHGFLAVTGLHFLSAEPRRFDDAPGAWSTDDDGPRVELDATDEHTPLLLDGAPIDAHHSFGPIPERGGLTLTWGDAVIEVARRGGHDIVRPRHPNAPILAGYTGTPTYPPNPRWLADGTFVPFAEPRPTTVGAAVDGLQHVYSAPGVVEFTLRGDTHRLTVFDGDAPGSLFALFTDATSGLTTYAANRSLAIGRPADDGRVVLDFNRAVNLPCAYTDLATCPLPPAENRLDVAIEAGEKTPLERLRGA